MTRDNFGPVRHTRQKLRCLFAGILISLCTMGDVAAVAASSTSEPAAVSAANEEHLHQVAALIKQYFPHAKVAINHDKLHVEYKVHPNQNLYTNLTEMAPDVGGILGDIEIKHGAYQGSEKLPKTQNQYSYMMLIMAPHSVSNDEHLYTRLCYAPDTPVDFVDQFTALIDRFGDGKIVESPAVVALTPAPAMVPPDKSAAISVPADSEKKTDKNIFLWKATRDNQIVYLLGTIHVATANFYPLPPEIDEAFDRSKELMVEIAIDRHKPDRAMIQELVKTSGTYAPSDRLSKHMSADTKKVFEDYLKWAGETWGMYEQYKPWYVSELVEASAPRRGEALKIKGALVLDNYFLGRAKQSGKPVGEFETLDFQLHLQSRLAEDVQDKLLQVTLLQFKDSLAQINQLFEAWRTGDAQKMEAIVNRPFIEHPELAPFNKILLDQRNLAMANKIDQISKTTNGPIFVAVGAAHLLGESGLVRSLRKKGFDVQQVYSNPAMAAKVPESELKVYGEDRFKVWCPANLQKDSHALNTRLVRYELADGLNGIYSVNVLDLPSDQSTWSHPGPLILDAMLPLLIKQMSGTVTARHSSTVQNFACRQIDFMIKNGAPDKHAKPPDAKSATEGDVFFTPRDSAWFSGKEVRVKACLVGTRVYMQMACGTKLWLNSPKVDKFMNSLQFIR